MLQPPLSDLLRRANDLTARNVQGNSAPPPPYAAESPLLEVLVEEVGAKLPGEFARAFRSGAATGQLEEWLSAGALYALVRAEADPGLARQFLERLAGSPRGAALSLATTLASRMGPPPMPASWLRCDLLGVALALSALTGFLLVRMFLLGLVAWNATFPGFGFWFGPLPPLQLAFIPPLRLPAPAWFAWLGLWFGVEAVVGPRTMELLRRVPARVRLQPAPLAWRVDAFNTLWALQALAMLALTLAAVSLQLVRGAHELLSLEHQMALRAAVAVLLFPVMFAVMADLGQTARLGSIPPRQSALPGATSSDSLHPG